MGFADIILAILFVGFCFYWFLPPASCSYIFGPTISGTLQFLPFFAQAIGIFLFLSFGAYYLPIIGNPFVSIYNYYLRGGFRNVRTRRIQATRAHPTTGSGDQGEDVFYDLPEPLNFFPPETESSQHSNVALPELQLYRLRRRRMKTTILRDSNTKEDDLLEDQLFEALNDSINRAHEDGFFTPHPSPQPLRIHRERPNSITFPENKKISLLYDHMTNQDESAFDPEEAFTLSSYPLFKENKEETKIFNKLTLHQFPRGLAKPCLSCDGMFVETFIRLIGIPYLVKLDCLETTGPWLTWSDNGNNRVCGVNDCIKFLKQHFSHRFIEYKNTELIVRLEHLSWGLRSWRWLIENGEEFSLNQPGWDRICKDFECLKKTVKMDLINKGYGTKTYQDLTSEIERDIETLSNFLGNKLFLSGNTPSEIDCSAFSIICQFMWGHVSIFQEKLKSHKNLVDYCHRLRDYIWSDWDQQLGSVLEPELTISFNTSDNSVIDANTEVFEDIHEQKEINNKTNQFQNEYYQLLPLNDLYSTSAQSENFDSTQAGFNDFVISCSRCKISEHEQISESNSVTKFGDLDFHFIDDELQDMQTISYSSHNTRQ